MKLFPRSMNSSRSLWFAIVLAIVFFLFAIPAFMLGGVTWDQIFHFEGVNGAFWHGINTVKGLNPDLSTITFDLEYFGNATRWPTYFTWRFLGTTPWESFSGLSRTASILSGSYVGLNHLNAAAFGFLGIIFAGLIGLCLGGRRLAVLSSIFLLTLPTWLGHSWMNSKDIPFATSYLIYTYGSILLLSAKINKPPSEVRRSAFLFRFLGVALLLGSRIGALPFVLISEFVYLLLLKRSYLKSAAALILGSFLAFLLTPQAWSDPIGYPIEAIRFISDRQGSPSPLHTLSYIAFHLYETLPLLVVIGFLVLPLSWSLLTRSRQRVLVWIPVLLQLLIAPALLILGSKSIYNELRHILFIYPSICILSAAGWLGWIQSLPAPSHWRRAVSCCACALFVLLLMENVFLSPFQYLYRSDLARILESGHSLHRDYWGFSSRETTARCLKNQQCSSMIAQVPYQLRKGDWNPDLFYGLRELLQSPRVIDAGSSDVRLQLQIAPARDSCRSLVETTRIVLFPSPKQSLISRVADCS